MELCLGIAMVLALGGWLKVLQTAMVADKTANAPCAECESLKKTMQAAAALLDERSDDTEE